MMKAIYLQIGATLLCALLAGLVAGVRGAVSASLGGLACLLPATWFALRLRAAGRRPGGALPTQFFIGEFIKVAATVGLLAIAIKAYPEMHWPSLLIGMAVVLQASFFAFWKKS
jgi:ATP synthase protein I